MSKITAQRARDICADRVNECASLDTRILDDLIHYGEFRAWRSGRWVGSERVMRLKVYEDRIVLPDEWNVLLGINVDGRNQDIRGYWYEFDKFGPGTVTEPGFECKYTQDQILQLEDVCLPWAIGKGEWLGVRSSRPEDESNFVLVQGLNPLGKEIYTTNLESLDGTLTSVQVHGEKLKFHTNKITRSSAQFDHDGILCLLKSQPTNGTLTFYALTGGTGRDRELGEMRPEQMESALKSYRLPSDCCGYRVVQALCKRSEPKRITKSTDVLQIENEEALILLVKSAYYDLQANDRGQAQYFFNQGLAALSGQYAQQRGGKKMNIRMDGMTGIDRSWNPRTWA